MITVKKAIAAIPSRFHRIYARCKFATDPLYDAVENALATAPRPDLPLLDIGCGMGLLAFHLRSSGFTEEITGIDYDARKVALGQAAVENLRLRDVTLAEGDARRELPGHSGHVTILDILQFLSRDEQTALLAEAAARIAPGGRLVIRSGLASGGFRFDITRSLDRLSRRVCWMREAPKQYPTRDLFEESLRDGGLRVTCSPLWGRTPFHNFLITGTRVTTDG